MYIDVFVHVEVYNNCKSHVCVSTKVFIEILIVFAGERAVYP